MHPPSSAASSSSKQAKSLKIVFPEHLPRSRQARVMIRSKRHPDAVRWLAHCTAIPPAQARTLAPEVPVRRSPACHGRGRVARHADATTGWPLRDANGALPPGHSGLPGREAGWKLRPWQADTPVPPGGGTEIPFRLPAASCRASHRHTIRNRRSEPPPRR